MKKYVDPNAEVTVLVTEDITGVTTLSGTNGDDL